MSDKPQFINPPNGLRNAIVGSGPAKLDAALLKQAELAVGALEDGFAELAASSLDEVREALARAEADTGSVESQLRKIFTLVMDLKGQGATYDYLMLTEIGDLLMRFTEVKTALNSRDIKVMSAHIDAM